MTQSWRKLGRIFYPSGQFEWMQTHASVPIAEPLGGDLFRIYFSTRDAQNRSATGWIVIDIAKLEGVLDISKEPVLRPGALGEFDDSGAMATWLASYEGKKYLYYIGWNLGVTVPFRNAIGLAVADAQGSFSRYSAGPVVDRTRHEPHFCASCCVLPGPGLWRMWYLSCTGWFLRRGKPEHRYHIKYAESSNGIDWTRGGKIAIDFLHEHEYAISRPCVLRDRDNWKMWYSYRGSSYRIGYAESADGLDWQRLDTLVGMDVSPQGWDSEMIEYPFVFDHKGLRYMLYNGNGFGRTGIGLAVLD